jgi:hypothetical protein
MIKFITALMKVKEFSHFLWVKQLLTNVENQNFLIFALIQNFLLKMHVLPLLELLIFNLIIALGHQEIFVL